MESLDLLVFEDLFRTACLKCFGYPLKEPLTETESKLFYNKIFDQTGLTIGWKSLKNYAQFIVSDAPGKQENPSVATMDTLARYVLDVPYTTEPERKEKEGHFPYWFKYKEEFLRGRKEVRREKDVRGWRTRSARLAGMLLVLVLAGAVYFFRKPSARGFTDDFHSVADDSLAARGWQVSRKAPDWWKRRGENPGGITLFTLEGSDWPDSVHAPMIRDLLWREIPCDCFTLEVRLKHFIPRKNWQQAGILLMEDTGFAGKSIRISLAYNDYNGGYGRSRSILIQAITSRGDGSGKPEEVAHIPLFDVDSLDAYPVLQGNLEHAALRIERRGNQFRFLYSSSLLENASFRELARHEFPMNTRYAGLFAFRGFVTDTANMPVLFNYFELHCEACQQ